MQEALTNVVKHARTGSCRVLIGYGQDELILEVTDNGAGLPEMASAGISHHGSPLALAGAFAADAGLEASGPTLLATRRAGTRPATSPAGTASSGCASG